MSKLPLNRISKRHWIILSLILAFMLSFILSMLLYALPLSSSSSSAYQLSQRSFVPRFLSLLQSRRPRREGIRRSENLCPITPGLVETDKLWNDHPLFVWQGTIDQITLKLFDTDTVIWKQSIDRAIQQIAYDGAALQPGLYQWQISRGTSFEQSYVFEIISENREVIQTGLAQVEAQLNGSTLEEITLAKADFFAEQNLWSDAFQMVYSIANPSANAQQIAQEIGTYVCPPNATP